MIPFWDPSSLPYNIEWDAWATLAVGIAAVVGAYRIGRKQLDIAYKQAQIMEKQNQIAARQAQIEHTRLQAELYDRRTICYAGLEQYLSEANSVGGKVSNETRIEFWKAFAATRFLLGEDVEKIAREIHLASVALRRDVSRFDRLGENDEDMRRTLRQAIEDHHVELDLLSLNLRTTMDVYLRLSESKS